MGRYDHGGDERVWRALVVDSHGAVSWDEWIRTTSRADDGRDVTEETHV